MRCATSLRNTRPVRERENREMGTHKDPHTVEAAARIRWILGSWVGRGLLALVAVILSMILVQRAEDRRIEEITGLLVANDRVSAMIDVLEDAVHDIGRGLSGAGDAGESPSKSIAVARRTLQDVKALPRSGMPLEVSPLLAVLEGVEEAQETGSLTGDGTAAEKRPRLIAALDYEWEVLRDALRQHQSERLMQQAKQLQLGVERRLQWSVTFVILAVTLIVWPLWMSWNGRERLRVQISQLLQGQYGRKTSSEGWDEHRELTAGLNVLSRQLLDERRSDQEERHRQHRLLHQLKATLESASEGNYHREFRPDEDGAWSAVAASLHKLLDNIRSARQKEAEDARSAAKAVSVPKESILELERMLRARDGDADKVSKLFAADNPLRGVAFQVAVIVGRQQEVIGSMRDNLSRVVDGAREIVGSVVERESNLEKEYAFVHETSSTVDEVSVAARESAQMVEHVLRASQKAMETAEAGRDLVSQSIESMNVITNQVNTIAHHILGLSRKSQEIGNIVRAIGEVSKQTNLLALNAAIEAAGAGEHGKGFAVVAKEIRDLAIKSSKSTQDIESLIRDMQNATNTAVLSTEEGSKSVEAGVGLINSLNHSFGRIVDRFQEVVESAQQISAAAQEQTTGSRQVASSIGSIDRMMLSSVKELRKLKVHLEQYQVMAGEFEKLVQSGTENSASA